MNGSSSKGLKSSSTKCSHEYPKISSIYTHVMKCGELDEKKRLVLVIPGNPGAIGFYEEFMKCVHDNSGWPVWGVSHAGQATVPRHVGWTAPNNEVFTIQGQIEHKLEFIRKFVPEDVEIVLIGHSIGAYVILEVMDKLNIHHIREGMLLFPTIEKMAESPRGKRLQKVLTNWRWLLIFMAALLWLLPYSVKEWLIRRLFHGKKSVFKPGVPDCILKSAHDVVDPYCVSNTTYMAALELQQIADLKEEMVKRNLHRLRFYYGATDHWCPQELYYKMKELFPSHEKIELCSGGHRHAFIIDSSLPMAGKVAEWLNEL